MRKTSLTFAIKTIVFVCVAFYIWYVVEHKDQFDSVFRQSVVELYRRFHLWLLIPLMLFFVNWSIEALKWKYLIQKLENISFIRAFRGILTGVALGLATPLNLGDYAGRIFQLNNPQRAKAVGAVFISRISQFYITLLWGSFSLLYLYSTIRDTDSLLNMLLLFFIILSHLFLAMLLFFHRRIMGMIREISFLNRWYPYLEIISEYSLSELLYTLCLSFFRYFIFSIQFIMILYFFDVSHDPVVLLMGVNFIFLAKSVIPTFFDLGVRESAAVYFFTAAGYTSDKIIFASLSLWVINILLPAVIGLFLIFRLKIFSRI